MSAHPDNLLIHEDSITLYQLRSKTSLRTGKVQACVLYRNRESKHICPVECIKLYLKKSKRLRKDNQSLFFDISNPSQNLSVYQATRWVKQIFIDIGNFYNPSSVRHAAASFIRSHGCSMSRIMQQGDWRSSKTLDIHYLSSVLPK